jgi:hypothetical protein
MVGNPEVIVAKSAPSHHRRLPWGCGHALRTALTERVCHSHPPLNVEALGSSPTFSTANGHLRTHLEADWKDVSIEHITIDSVNEWIWKKRNQDLSWITIKNILRTMQRVLVGRPGPGRTGDDSRPP